MYFCKANPVWADGLQKEKHITLGLYNEFVSESCCAELKIATSGYYRVFINDIFVSHGPSRCAHGYFRVDTVSVPLNAGTNRIAIEVVNYYINGFSSLMQPGFIQAELTIDGKVIAATGCGDFELYRLLERIRKIQRYSYQRPMAESYRLKPDVYGWRKGTPDWNALTVSECVTEPKNLIDRRVSRFNFPVCAPETVIANGTCFIDKTITDFKKDRSLTQIGNPANAELGGWLESELELHLSDDIQQIVTEKITICNKEYGNKTELSAGSFTVLSFPCEKTGFIAFDLKCIEKGDIYIFIDEILSEKNDVDPLARDCVNAVKFETDIGEYPFQTVEPYGFKYLKIVCTSGKFVVENLKLIEMICPKPIIKSYNGSNRKLEKIFNAASENFKQNATDILMDCPTRERAGWLCDSFFTAKTESLLTGDNTIEHAFLENYLLPEKFDFLPDGMIPMCYPSDCLQKEFIPNWPMWFILELEDHIKRTGDADFVASFKKRVYDLLAYYSKFENEDGLIEKLEGWVFVEWSHANDLVQDINFPSNMLYAKALSVVGSLYNDDALTEKSKKLFSVIESRSFDGSFYVDNEVYRDGKPCSTGERTETCQYYAFFTGLATPESHPQLWNTLKCEFGPDRADDCWTEIKPSNMIVGFYLRLELLLRYGEYQAVLDECIKYFGEMAEKTGTLWENDNPYASCNHGFASYAAVLIYEAEKTGLKRRGIVE